MKDKQLKCKDCGKDFTFPVSEQEFYIEKGFSDPIRCVDCRRIKKQQRAKQQFER